MIWALKTGLAMGAVAAGYGAMRLDDPFAAPAASYLTWAILGASIAALSLIWGLRRTLRRRAAGFLAALWLFAVGALAVIQGQFALSKSRVLAAPAPIAQNLGAHFIVGYRHVREVETLIARGLIGGVFLSQHAIKGMSAAKIASEIARLQALRRANGLAPLIVACDQEGGALSRLSPPLPRPPALRSLAATPLPQATAAAEDIGRAAGADLRGLGVNFNFAPVLDLRPDHAPDAQDRMTRIYDRAISDDPRIVTAIGAAYMRGLAQAGVTGSAKHFPGLGGVADDTHHFRAWLKRAPAELEARDFVAFRDSLAQAPGALMVGHVIVEGYDAVKPASQSAKLIKNLVRDGWGYDGLIVTDDLVMSAVFHYGPEQGIVDTANAGVDLWLVAYDGRQYYRLMAALLEASARGALDEATLAQSARRLANWTDNLAPAP